MRKLIFINSHPIQYFAPLYRYMSEKGFSVATWYASGGATHGEHDSEFGVPVQWDIPLLDGYEHRIFRNNSWHPSHATGFWGLMNLSMIAELFRIPRSVIALHGWHYFTHFTIILLGKLAGHVVCLRNDMPLSHEAFKSGWKQRIKQAALKHIIFPRIDYFLYIGSQNRSFYESYGIADNRLISCPYAVDNDRFDRESGASRAQRASLGIPATDKVILYSAKYISKKRPLDLLRAFRALDAANCWLVMVGEGELRPQLEQYIAEHQLTRVILTGFVNQQAIPAYYAASDVFVMCSSLGENWGLSVNEAMNFDLPIVASDLTGCSDDLVVDGSNGYVFKTGDVADLTAKLKKVLLGNELSGQPSSKDIIASYSYATILHRLRAIPELNGELVV